MKTNTHQADIFAKVQRQEDTIAQLIKIVAATNNRVFDLQLKFKKMEQFLQSRK